MTAKRGEEMRKSRGEKGGRPGREPKKKKKDKKPIDKSQQNISGGSSLGIKWRVVKQKR